MIFTSQLHVTDSCISPLSYFSLSSHGLRAIWSGLNLALATTFLAETLLFLLSSQVIVLVSSSVFDNVKQIVSPTLVVNQHVYCLHFPFTEKENPIYLILLGFCSDCQSHSCGQPTCLLPPFSFYWERKPHLFNIAWILFRLSVPLSWSTNMP